MKRAIRGIAILCCAFALLIPSAQAGVFDWGGSKTQKRSYNERALADYIMDNTFASRQNATDIIDFFNKRTKRYLSQDDGTAIVFIVLQHRDDALGAIARTEGKRLIIELNYRPLPMDMASFNQLFDCRVERQGRRLLLIFRNAIDQRLVIYDDRNHKSTINIERVERILADKNTPFSEVFVLK